MQYYLVFNGAITGLAASLLNPTGEVRQAFAALVFLIGILACLLGRAAIRTSHQYYRDAAYKKTLIEDQLGLLKNLPGYKYEKANLSIATTAGMKESDKILHHTERWLSRKTHRPGSIVRYFRSFLLALAIINGVGILAATWPFSKMFFVAVWRRLF
jgi:hypothetical protein